MVRKLITAMLIFGTCNIVQAQKSDPANMVPVAGGTFVPLYGSNKQSVTVPGFLMDKYPVTNSEFEIFIANNQRWGKTAVKKLFVDAGYLRHWSSAGNIGVDSLKVKDSPVINVSWFAAKAYCECLGKRLPTVNEWEFAALASETKPDAASEPGFYQRSLDWYGQPNPKYLPPVQESFRNYYGLYGMIGLVWEWTSDFNSAMIVGESRANSSLDRQLFCGAGSTGASDVKNYVAFMRYAFRSSLKANFTVGNLGFRCVKDLPAKPTAKL